MDLTTILDDLKSSAPATAGERISIEKLVPVPATPADLTCSCEHGTPLGEYAFHALAFISDKWIAKNHHDYAKCIFVVHKDMFDLIDGKCRALVLRNPGMGVCEALAKVVKI